MAAGYSRQKVRQVPDVKAKYGHNCLVIAGLCVLAGPVFAPVIANNAFAASQTHVTARIQSWQAAEPAPALEPDGETVERNEFFLDYHQKDRGNRYSYAHQSILIRQGDPAHNGYFHRLDAEFTRQWFDTRVQVTLGVHGTSNMFRYGDFHGELLVGTLSLRQSLGKQMGIGFNGDYRFGHFRLYPTLNWQLPPATWGRVVMTLPVDMRWQSPGRRWELRLFRYGEKWATLDGDRERESAFYLEEWRLEAGWRFSAGAGWRLALGASIDTRVIYDDLQAGEQNTDLATAAYVAVAARF